MLTFYYFVISYVKLIINKYNNNELPNDLFTIYRRTKSVRYRRFMFVAIINNNKIKEIYI